MTMTAASSNVSSTQGAPPARWQIEWELCEIASDVSGVAREKISPTSRLIEDHHIDSLDLVDFLFRVEARFGITIPDHGESGICKQVFTRNPDWPFFHPARAAGIAPEIDAIVRECDLMVSAVAY